MKCTTEKRDSFALRTFKELIKIIECDILKEQMVEVINVINIQGIFEMNQDVNNLDYHTSCEGTVEEKFSKEHWFSLVDYLKENITQYESGSDKKFIKMEILDKIGNLAGSDIDFYIENHLSKTAISFNIKEKKLLPTTISERNGVKYQSEDFMENPNLDLLNLFDFSFCKNLLQLIKSLDSELSLFLLKNICGLLSNEEFADYLIIKIKNNLSDMLIDWMLSVNCNKLELDLYPISFYDSEFIKSLISLDEDYSIFLKSINDKPKIYKKVSFVGFYKIKKFYKNCLLEIIDGSIYNEYYKYAHYHLGLKTISFTDNQISKLKKELIPLLEELDEKGKIFLRNDFGFEYLRKEFGSKNFIKQSCRKDGVIVELMGLLDWYPKNLNFYFDCEVSSSDFINYHFMKHSSIKYASKIEGFDYHIFVTVWKCDNEDWQEGMFDQIKSIANEVLGNVTIQIVVPSSSDGYSEQVMFAQEYDSYNRISSKYLIIK